jgi:membrane protein implicated in regulation of membrane protease activity
VNVVTAKAWLGGAALVVGLAGMALDVRWLIWVAVALLLTAFLLRFVKR